MAFYMPPRSSIESVKRPASVSIDEAFAHIPTAVQAKARSELTQEQVESYAYPIIMTLAQSIDRNIHRQSAVYAFPSGPNTDLVPRSIGLFVTEFFRARGYTVTLREEGIILEWDNPRRSEHDALRTPVMVQPEERIMDVHNLPDGSVQYTGVQGQSEADYDKPLPKYTIGTGERTVVRKP